jgi:hypothetical protein
MDDGKPKLLHFNLLCGIKRKKDDIFDYYGFWGDILVL